MTAEQYANTISYVFGPDIVVGQPFAPLQRTDGLLASGASSAGVTIGELQQLQRSAAQIAAQVIDQGSAGQRTPPHREFLVPCKPQRADFADDVCADKFIRRAGRLLYRQSLNEAVMTDLVGTAHKSAVAQKDFYAGLATVTEAMLIDPGVLLIVDTTEPDPRHPGKRRLTSYALASRLSFFLWNAAPDDALLKAAETGELYTAKGRARVVDAMLASPRLEAGMRAFFDDMFGFEEFEVLTKDQKLYPMVNGQTLDDAREQTLRTAIDHLVTRNGDYRDLFTTRDTFLSPALSLVYNLPAPNGWQPYTFPADSPRAGLLSQISFLSLHSHPTRSSATKRGKALRELLLCQTVPPPPANVDFSAVENPDPRIRTARERLDVHGVNPVCAGCHRLTDPIGLGLETFDGAGRYRETERGAKIDASGSLDGAKFTSANELGQALRNHPALPSCLVKRLYSYGTGSAVAAADAPAVKALTAAFTNASYRLPNLLRSIVMNDAFSEVIDQSATAATKPEDAAHTAAQ